MKKFEYMTTFLGGAPAQDGPSPRSGLDERRWSGRGDTPHLIGLNDAGNRGWELVSMNRYGEGFYAIFKRERQ